MKRTIVLAGVVVFLALAAASQSARRPAALLTYSAGPTGGLCLARPDGTRRLRLTGVAGDRDASWSPDGKYVVLVRGSGAQSGIVIVDARGRFVRQIASGGAADPAWAPSGKRIAFATGGVIVQGIAAGTRIVIASSDGSLPNRILPTGPGDASSPAWSPDGRRIAYTSRLQLDRQGPIRSVVRIQVIGADGTDRRPLVDLGGEPSWAPDGSKVAYIAYPSLAAETGHLAVVNANGTGARRLTSGSEAESSPSWSPRGRLIAFSRGLGAASAVFVIRPDGSRERMVIRSRSYNAFAPAWRRPVTLPKARRPAC